MPRRERYKAGCRLCKQRKARCDLKRPVCGPCRTEGQHGPCEYEETAVVLAAARREAASLPRTFNPVQQQDSFFWAKYLPDTPFRGGGKENFVWSRAIQDLSARSNLVRTSLDALGIMCLSQNADNNPGMTRSAISAYNVCLRSLAKRLESPKNPISLSELAATSITFGIFEIIRTDVQNSEAPARLINYKSHMAAVQRLAKVPPAKGTKRSAEDKALLTEARYSIIGLALAGADPTIIDIEAWKDDNNRDTWLGQDNLFDLLSFAQSIILDHQALNKDMTPLLDAGESAEHFLPRAQTIIQKSISVGQGLRDWQLKHFVMPAEIDDNVEAFAAQGQKGFMVLIHCWIGCLRLFDETVHTYQQILQVTGSARRVINVPPLPDFIDPEHYAHRISCAAPWFFNDSASIWGHSTIPLGVLLSIKYYAETKGPTSEEVVNLSALIQQGPWGAKWASGRISSPSTLET